MAKLKDITGLLHDVETKADADPIMGSALSAIGDGVINQEVLNSGTGEFEIASFNFEVKATDPVTMDVTVNDGSALIKGQIIGSSKIKDNQLVATLTIGAADPTNPRKDLIVLKTDTDQFGVVKNRGNALQTDFEVIAGTPDASPVVAKTDAQLNKEGKVRVGTVTVPAGASSIGAGDIDNAKDYIGTVEGPADSTELGDMPSSLTAKQHIAVNAGGTAYVLSNDIKPVADITGDIGGASERWANIYAQNVVTGDLDLVDESKGAHWKVIEEADMVTIKNMNTGKRYKFDLTELS